MPNNHDWRECTLGDIAEEKFGMADGPFGSNLPASLYTPVGVPIVRGSNLSLGQERFDAHEFVFVSEETAERLARSLCKPDDIIFTKKGTLGQTGIIPGDIGYSRFLLSSNQMKLAVSREVADPLFVYYFVSSPESRDRIIRESTASGVPKINLAYLRKFPIALPPLPEQQKIAHILGALDKKIELNRRMNRTLEAMAAALFKSWFVDFDPVTAKAEGRALPSLQRRGAGGAVEALFPSAFQDSEIGLIPQGWQFGTIGDVGQNPRRGVHPNEVAPETPYIGLEHMPRKSIELSDWGRAENVISGKFKFRKGEILFGKLRPFFHKVGVAPVDGVCSTDVLVVTPKQPEWFGLLLSHLSSVDLIIFVDAASEGTRMPRTNWETMSRFEIAIPTPEVAEAYTKLARSLIARIHSNIMESRTLASIRDALLPKLLSGEIRVRRGEASA